MVCLQCGCFRGWNDPTALLLGLDHPERFRAVILVGGSSGGGGRTGDRIEGHTDDVTTYHEKHIKELVAPGLESTRLGKYLLDIFLERNPCSTPWSRSSCGTMG